MDSVISYKVMDLEDFKIVRVWCIKEGWNLGIHDSNVYKEPNLLMNLV